MVKVNMVNIKIRKVIKVNLTAPPRTPRRYPARNLGASKTAGLPFCIAGPACFSVTESHSVLRHGDKATIPEPSPPHPLSQHLPTKEPARCTIPTMPADTLSTGGGRAPGKASLAVAFPLGPVLGSLFYRLFTHTTCAYRRKQKPTLRGLYKRGDYLTPRHHNLTDSCDTPSSAAMAR